MAAALLFGALRTGGGLMQVKTGIPLDLLMFIQALVIMFVAAPGPHPGDLADRPAQEGADAPRSAEPGASRDRTTEGSAA